MAMTAKTADLHRSGLFIPVRASVRTDQDGKYRFTTLPPGTYSIWSDVPDFVTKGVLATDAASKRPTQLPDLIMIQGGIISARIVDAETGQPIALEDEMHAMLIADSSSSPPSGRAQTNHAAKANPHGRFDLRVPAGKHSFLVGFVFSSDGTPRWVSRRRPDVNVAEGQTVEVDVPVEKYELGPV
jgi:protocatechuate 3,4-dioxygenase beta subunit